MAVPKSVVRKTWEAKKSLLKIRIAFLTVFLSFIGFELGTPGYSLTEHLSRELVDSSETLKNAIEKNARIREFFTKEGQAEEPNILVKIIDSGALGGPIKTFVMVMLMYFVLYIINMKDPFSNYELLRELGLSGCSRRKSWCQGNEIAYYAQNVPSHLLHRVCDACIHGDNCGNRLKKDDADSMKRWSAVFGVLEIGLVEKDLKSVHSCRRAYYYKYMFLWLGILLTVYYILIRSYEYAFNPEVNINHGLLLYIGGCFLACSAYSWINSFQNDSDGGAWCRHKQHVEEILGHRFLDEAYRERVCKCYDNPHYLERKKKPKPLANEAVEKTHFPQKNRESNKRG